MLSQQTSNATAGRPIQPSASASTLPSILEYNDFRVFLREYHTSKKQRNPGWSRAVWARKLGIRSPSTLGMILNGQRDPGKNLVKSLITYFQFNRAEGEHFATLVELAKHAADAPITTLLMEKLAKHLHRDFNRVDLATFTSISAWYCYAIREMVHLRDFRPNPNWIASKLKYFVPPRDVRDAVATLLKLGLLKKDESGKITYGGGHIETPTDVADEAVKRYHEQALENAKRSLRQVSVQEREFFGSTFALPLSKIPQAKAMIRKFNDEFCDLLESSPGEAVYQLEIAFFPLTVKEGETCLD